MAEVIWRPEALADLDEAIGYIEWHDPAAAARTRVRLTALGNSLCDFPNRGRAGPRGIRELPSVSPYVLRYAVEGDTVFILGIRHGRRRPLD